MNDKERAKLMRKGNELFNQGDIDLAAKVFITTGYMDGIIRVADYYFFDKRLPLNALPYYRMAKRQDKVDEIYERMFFALKKMVGKEEPPKIKVELPPLKVSPKLKIIAEEILRNQEKQGQENS